MLMQNICSDPKLATVLVFDGVSNTVVLCVCFICSLFCPLSSVYLSYHLLMISVEPLSLCTYLVPPS